MDRLIEFFRQQPLVLLVVLAWIAGIVGNIAKAAKKARERAAERARGGRMPAPEPTPVAQAPADPRLPQRSADDIEREMARILRGGRGETAPSEPEVGDVMVEHEPSPPPPPLPSRRNVPEPERPPVPVVPTTGTRRLPVHVDPHVGEAIGRRASVQSDRIGAHAPGRELGTLGGRATAATGRRMASHRYALDDLKRVIVLNEILGPPLALRGRDERQG